MGSQAPPLLSCPSNSICLQPAISNGGVEVESWGNMDTDPWETFPDCFVLASCCLGFSAHLHLAPSFQLS